MVLNRKKLVAAAFVDRCEFVRRALAFFKRYICVEEADSNEERHDTRDGLELADFDIVVRCTGPCCNQKFFHAVIADSAHDPDAVITRTFLVRRLLAQDFGAITAFHEFAESSLRDHIWCFDFPVHGPVHAFFKGVTLGIPT
ncbi:MAG: hypothetical protein ACI90E_002015 [Yoonia sp.]|jgi:hypothetical protein